MAYQQVPQQVMQCHYNSQTRAFLSQELPYIISRLPTLQAYPVPIVERSATKNFMCLQGTIPVPYQGNTYNIPIRIVFKDLYPNIAPDARVEPTPSMVIKPSEYVDDRGTVKLLLLNQWTNQNNASQLIDEMQRAFSYKMPLFARKDSSSQSSSHNQPQPAYGSRDNSVNYIELCTSAYLDKHKKLSQEIESLRKDHEELKEKQQEAELLLQYYQTCESNSDQQSQGLIEAKGTLQTWLEQNREVALENLPSESLFTFANALSRQYLKLLARNMALDQLCSIVTSSFNSGNLSATDLVKHLKGYNAEFFMNGILLDKLAPMLGE